ncbi:unnamed protein product [Paramecium pentaurelia]|uniref:Uncharacterized protein n=1 Tax=Paramecium pentaurelia TaxID=43138 RepID=A0A8S1T9T1_9CILI|nr:unnamed protein product [Paramecium pentaurelia]
MSTFISTKQESFIERQLNTQQSETVKQYTSYTTEPTLLKEDYAVKKIERPEAYQFWHKKEKYNSYASRVLNTNYRSCSVINPGQSFQINNVGSGISHSQVDNNNEFQCCTKQQMVVSVVIVSREEIEQPWREECLYLQSVIKELEKKKEIKVVKEIDYARIKELEEENHHLQLELQQAQESTLITERVTQNNSEVEVWKRKFQEVNHDYNEAQEKLMNVEIELEALKKEKARAATATTTVTRSTVRTGTSSVRQAGQI